MTPRRLILATAILPLFGIAGAAAQTLSLEGFGEVKLLKPSQQQSWSDGGLGKASFDGAGHRSPDLRLNQAIVEGHVQFSEDLTGNATLRLAPDQDQPLDLLDGYVRYRPVSTRPWRFSVKLGAFFPPISLENDEVGWSSPYTITSSAINTWVGEELRTFGGEVKAEWRFEGGSAEATGGLYGWNQSAGTLLADRGWSFGDQPTGLAGQLRLPDATAIRQRQQTPLFSDPFAGIRNVPGWYAGLALERAGWGRVSLLQYDNRADPAARRHGEFGWRTDFTSLGLQTQIDDLVLIGQAMTGETEIRPTATVDAITHFQAAFLLASLDLGDWRPAVRFDVFATDVHPNPSLGEHGHATTLALNWAPRQWLRLTGEALYIDSTRGQRATVGLSPEATEVQLQLGARIYF